MSAAREEHPEVYNHRDDDPRTRKRTVPMQVLSLGYSRTGTMSIRAALEILGIPTWHWVTQSENPADLGYWTEALKWKFGLAPSGTPPFGREQFDHLLGSWGACTDQPAAIFTEELVRAYPEAKVLLVERNLDTWAESFWEVVIKGTWDPLIAILEKIDSLYIRQFAEQSDLIAHNYFGVKEKRASWCMNNPAHFLSWRDRAKSTYMAHNELVKRVTPPDRLLTMRLEDGWPPLCKFLGKEVPDVPFPKVNETKAIKEKINLYVAEGYKRSVVKLAKRAAPIVVALGAAILVRCWYH